MANLTAPAHRCLTALPALPPVFVLRFRHAGALIAFNKVIVSMETPLVPQIHVGTETEGASHWSYQVVVRDDQQTYDYQVTLSWADYDLWSHGRVAPEKVIQAAFRYLLEREPASEILTRFDCSVIRRFFPNVDSELPRML